MTEPRIASLAIAPVKGLGLAYPETVWIDEHGAAGDRRFALVADDGRPVSVTKHPSALRVTAESDAAGTWLRLRFPDGALVTGEVEAGAPVRVRTWRRELPGTLVGGPWDAALRRYLDSGVRLVRVERGAVDDAAVSAGSSASLAAFAAAADEAPAVAGGRFRLNLVVDGLEAHEEESWVGRCLAAGDAVLRVRAPIPRCAVTCLHPTRGERDRNALQVLRRMRGLSERRTLDLGVYADVVAPGRARVGAPVRLLPR